MTRTLGCWALLLCSAVGLAAEKAPRPALTKAQLAVLEDEILPAHEQGSASALVATVAPFVARINDTQLEAANDWLAEHEIPAIDELLSGARVELIEQNLAGGLPPPKGRELALTVRGLNARLDEVLGLYRTHPAFDESAAAPANLDEYEKRLWDMHVLENRLAAARRMGEFAQKLAQEASRQNAKGFTPEDRTLLSGDYDKLLSNLDSMGQHLREREMELRLQRLEHAVKALEGEPSPKEKFQAAFVVDLDGDLLAEFATRLQRATAKAAAEAEAARQADLQQQPRERKVARDGDDESADEGEISEVVFSRTLNDPNLPARIEQLRDQGRQAAGEDLLKKSRALFTGLHWWYRGRYGMGTHGHGLLKSPAALKSPQAMFALYMPAETAQPTDPASLGPQVPQVDRRHHYLWQFETRRIETSRSSYTNTTRSSETLSKTTTKFDRFY